MRLCGRSIGALGDGLAASFAYALAERLEAGNALRLIRRTGAEDCERCVVAGACGPSWRRGTALAAR